ncbi:hypothetical protein RLO149_c021220 [Roseobacter litoralis Och 149]|uniref:Uncharacterized protein n=1 Tax=Roseobacter litoralis (strain ATCC 49566 / DSM 6996 / JCM 21268 / NBRC 15278 / OCh 149) TaxID=391595 RepID=F7ZLP7_ROSLO|nr:hypothetical protein RLO149_c021220 [Roseobacter litoralis Och 149]
MVVRLKQQPAGSGLIPRWITLSKRAVLFAAEPLASPLPLAMPCARDVRQPRAGKYLCSDEAFRHVPTGGRPSAQVGMF